MSKIKDNIVTRGLSGKLGKQIVFRQWSGDTFLAKAPVVNSSSTKSEMRLQSMLRFKDATIYAKKAMNDAELKQAYQKKCKARQNAYARAVQDFFIAPSIEEIDVSNYTGEPDSFIQVYAIDDFRVKRVKVRIEDNESNEVDAGWAEREGNTDWWRYMATVPNPLPEGGKVIAFAYNQPGNEATKEVIL